MSDRITDRQLDSMATHINKLLGTPLVPYSQNIEVDGLRVTADQPQPQAYCYHIESAYNGVALHRMAAQGTGVSDVLSCGYTTKRDLYNRMRAFIEGIHATREATARTAGIIWTK